MKEKKITLNADKRKVIADQFQSFYENKVKDKLIQAKEHYDLMREKASRIKAWLQVVNLILPRLIPDPCGYRHNGKQKLYLRMLCCATGLWDQN